MDAIQRIVAGIDFSKYSQEVMEYAGDIAARNSAMIIAVSVISKRHLHSIKTAINDATFSALVIEQFIEDEIKRRKRNMQDLFNEKVPAHVVTKTLIKKGVPFEEILQVAAHEDADLVVISSKGKTNLQDYMMGTTSEKIFRHCPVNLFCLNLGK